MTRLLGDDLLHLLKLVEEADSIELKLTLPARLSRTAGAALGFDPLNAQIRQIFFFDTPDLALDAAAWSCGPAGSRASSDSVVKLRPVVPAELDPELFASRRASGSRSTPMPGGYVCSGSMKGKLPADAVLKSVSGDRPLRKLFSKEQRAFFAAHAPEGLTLDDLSVLGPIFVLKLKAVPGRLHPADGGGDVALPGRRAGPRAVHQVSSREGLGSQPRPGPTSRARAST